MEEANATQRVSIKRIAKFFLWLLAGLLGVIVLLAAYAVVADVIHWHNFRRDNLQSLDVFPKPLPDTSLATAQGITTLTRSGCSIDLPWSDLKTRGSGFASLADGRALFFPDPANEVDEAAIYRGGNGLPSTTPLFGAVARSNYDLLAAQLNFNPKELTPLPWGRGHERQFFLAISKSTLMAVHKHQPIYSVAMGDVRGFQFGDPSQARRFVELRMFDLQDRQFRVHISSGASSVPWTQPEINYMIHSMRCDDTVYGASRKAVEDELRLHR